MPIAILLTLPAPGVAAKEISRQSIESYDAARNLSKQNPTHLIEFDAFGWAKDIYFRDGIRVYVDNNYEPDPSRGT